MLTLEDYISKRKKEDKINEFDIDSKMDNMRICVNYVFEYFDISKMDEKTVLNEERLEKYKKSLHQYEPEIQNWLVSIYNDYDKQLNRSIISFLKKDDLFFYIIQTKNFEVFRTIAMHNS